MRGEVIQIAVELEEDEEPLDFSDWPPDKDPSSLTKIEGRMFPIKEWSAPPAGFHDAVWQLRARGRARKGLINTYVIGAGQCAAGVNRVLTVNTVS